MTLKKTTVMLSLASLAAVVSAQTGLEIIERADRNTVVSTASYSAAMRISLGGKIVEKEFVGFVEGKNRAYLEFTAPVRDRGTRFLKIGDEMWIYLPSVERSTKIAGHMLRQNLMGSDFSYNDLLENEKLKELYEIELRGSDTLNGRECFVLELTAKVDQVSYYRRTLWVDKTSYLPVKVELYAKSGKLMKEITITDFKQIGGRNYPTRITMIDKLRKNTYTELVLTNVKLDSPIPDKIFTKSYLERK